MEVVSQPGYSEDLLVNNLEPAQYLPAIQQAAAALQWYPIGFDGVTITYQPPGSDYSQGEIVTITVMGNSVRLHSVPVNEYYWDEGRNRDNAERFKQALAQAVAAQEKANRSRHPMHREKYGALVPSKTYSVTPLIVYGNVLVFAVMLLTGVSLLNPTAQSLFLWGGNFKQAVMQGEWWRLLSYMFLHAGGMHLLGNTYALLYIGMFLEPLLGKFRFASAYLLTGIMAGLASIAMHPNSVGVGASGAIFGMYGVFLYILTTGHIQKTMKKTMLRSILFFVVFNLFMGLQGNTDNAAHIGGLVSGFLIGYIYYPGIEIKASLKKQALTTAILTAAVVLLGYISVRYLS